MIHVCSLARLYSTIEETGADRIVTLLKKRDRVRRPEHIRPEHHLILGMDDVIDELEGFEPPNHSHVADLVHFASAWDRRKPMVVHCFAGISRSTAAAFVAACALNPARREDTIARAIRDASPTAMPNLRIVSLADRLLERRGRMIGAVQALGPGHAAAEGHPFRLDLE
jgi:predicted protein tyrosine phosphatase